MPHAMKTDTLTVRSLACYSAFSFFTNVFSSMFFGLIDHVHGKQSIFRGDTSAKFLIRR